MLALLVLACADDVSLLQLRRGGLPTPEGYELVGRGHCSGDSDVPYHMWAHDVAYADCLMLCAEAWCQAFYHAPDGGGVGTCAAFVDPGQLAALDSSRTTELAARFTVRSDKPVLDVTRTDASLHHSDATCFKKTKHLNGHVPLSEFVSAQLVTAEACSAKVLEARRTADGVDARGMALKERYEAARGEELQARRTLEAAAAREDFSNGLLNEVASASATVLSAERALSALRPVLAEAHRELQRVAAHLEALRAACAESGAVSAHLERIRALVQALPGCPARSDFALAVPGVALLPLPASEARVPAS